MSALKDHIRLQGLLQKYVMEHGVKNYLNLLHFSIVDLSNYTWNKEEDKIIKRVYEIIYRAEKLWKS
jgi:hypothetical protein